MLVTSESNRIFLKNTGVFSRRGECVDAEEGHFTPDMVLGHAEKGNQIDLYDRYQTH